MQSHGQCRSAKPLQLSCGPAQSARPGTRSGSGGIAGPSHHGRSLPISAASSSSLVRSVTWSPTSKVVSIRPGSSAALGSHVSQSSLRPLSKARKFLIGSACHKNTKAKAERVDGVLGDSRRTRAAV